MVEQLDLFVESAKVTEADLQERWEDECKESKLTPRDWAVWRLIEHNSLVEHRKTTQKEICEKLGSEYDLVYLTEEGVHDHCVAIWKIIKDNNESLEHDKVIISKNFEYWIGSEKETAKYLAYLWRALAPRLHRYWAFTKKLSLDGVGKIISNQGDLIDLESQAKLFHECFNDFDITLQKAVKVFEEEDKEEKKKEKEEKQDELQKVSTTTI